MGGENLQKYFCRPLPSAAGPAYYYEIYVGGNNRARALVPGERYATLDQGSVQNYREHEGKLTKIADNRKSSVKKCVSEV